MGAGRPDELTVNRTLESEPGAPAWTTLFGASTLREGRTRELLREFTDRAFELCASLPYHRLKQAFATSIQGDRRFASRARWGRSV
ncbi:hypothetical protein [Micromonospora sp. WMMD812]|uniref:hypothetical protein n=1 Tax=Micromonospora sp. WMMD812 TaxID=3015152 RepID=UPI00248B201F|nr:hypothetical protein [Micromonospora sp. WMMD812]WBB69334.1 hypothetical protein O7603_08290 [Micromonospora sp. WMMD812]